MASNAGQFSAWRRFVRAPLESDDRDYRKIAIEHRFSNARQSDAGLSHEFQTRPRTDINAVNAGEREQRKETPSSTETEIVKDGAMPSSAAKLRFMIA